MLRSAQFISINFEDLNFSHLQTAKSLHDEITTRAAEINGKVYLFFDEIQEVKDWEKCINSLRVSLDCDIYITGSNAKLLSGELSTYLGGRFVEFVIYPFSFAEFLELLRRDYKVTVGRTGDKEIDFVCDKSGEKLYVQVAYLLASDETVRREFGAYDNIRDFLLAEEWN